MEGGAPSTLVTRGERVRVQGVFARGGEMIGRTKRGVRPVAPTARRPPGNQVRQNKGQAKFKGSQTNPPTSQERLNKGQAKLIC